MKILITTAAVLFAVIGFSTPAEAQVMDLQRIHPYIVFKRLQDKGSYATIQTKYLYVGNKTFEVAKKEMAQYYQRYCDGSNLGALVSVSIGSPRLHGGVWNVGDLYINCKK